MTVRRRSPQQSANAQSAQRYLITAQQLLMQAGEPSLALAVGALVSKVSLTLNQESK